MKSWFLGVFVVLVSLWFVASVEAYNFTDDFSDNSKISSMNKLSLDTNITLANVMNDTNNSDYLLLYSSLGSDNEILNPIVGHAGDPFYYYGFNDTNHYDYDSAMVGWWNFTTDANDSSGNNNHGTVTGATHAGEHYEFDGNGDYINVGNKISNYSGNITIAVWIKIEGNESTNNVFYNNYKPGFWMEVSKTGGVTFRISNSTTIETAAPLDKLQNGQWYHLVGVYDGLYIKSYLNGKLKKKISVSGPIAFNNSKNLYVGSWGGSTNFFNGSIDEFAIYNRSLNAEEISDLFEKTAASNTSSINYTTGYIGNASYLNATSDLTFNSTNFYGSKGTISFSASFSDWSVDNDQYLFYTEGKYDSWDYIRIRKSRTSMSSYFHRSGESYLGSSSIYVHEFNPNSWHNFTLTWDSNIGYMATYVDNHVSETLGGGMDESKWMDIFSSFNPSKLYIGRGVETGHELNGTIDELRILNETYGTTEYLPHEVILGSIAFDTGVSNPIWGNISWTENLPDKTDIELQISVSNDNITWTSWTGLSKGLVTLTFDDGYLSHYTNASTNMTPFGYKGVAYIISDRVGNDGYMNSTQLFELQNLRWGIGGHSKTHAGLINLNETELITEINDSYQNLTNLGLTQKHFAYPGGFYNVNAIDVISDYYDTARRTTHGYHTYNSKYKLKTQEGSNGVSIVKGYIDDVANNNSWLTLMFHEIGVPGGTSNVNLSDFNEILSYLNTSNVDVVTIDEALGSLSTYRKNLGEQIKAASKRYIKYRAILHSYNGSNTPTLDNIRIQYLPMNISTAGFDGSTTNFFDVANLSNISNMVLEKSSYGKVNVSESVDLNISKNYSLNTYVSISQNYISINSTALSELNKSATLSLYNLTFIDPWILRDGEPCPSTICAKLSYSGGTLIFNVTGFTNYSAEEDPIPPYITIVSPMNTVYSTSSIDFNVSGNENLSYCKFTVNDWGTNYTMTEFNSTYFSYTNSSVADGSYTARFWCNDSAGNVNSTESIAFSVDTTAPDGKFISPTQPNGTSLRRDNYFVNMTFSETISTAYLELTNGSGTINYTMTSENATTYSFNVTGQGDYQAYFYVYANDTVNNLNRSVGRFITIDTLNPDNVGLLPPTPANDTNLSQNNYFINVSFNDTNPQACLLELTNSTSTINYTMSAGANASEWNFNVTGNSDYKTYFYAYCNDTAGNLAMSSVRYVTIDTTAPDNVGFLNPTPSNDTNLSQVNYFINVSFNDTNPESCLLELANSSGTINYTMTRGANKTEYYFNVTGQTDNRTYFHIYCNDTADNWAASAARFITTDTTVPQITFSCSRSSVYQGETITCSCSATDSMDPSPVVSYAGSPSTSSIGMFTTICTAMDDAGNSASSGFTYTVSSSGGGGYPIYEPTQEQLEQGYEKSLKRNWEIQFEFNNETRKIRLDEIINKTAIITVSSEPITFNLTANETKKLHLDNDVYYDLEIFLKDISAYQADLLVKLIHEEIPRACELDWRCSGWSECQEGRQTRFCTDLNNCNATEDKPDEVKGCCEPDWRCDQWSECINGQQARTCTDLNNCNVTEGQPDEARDCCALDWKCSEWGECVNNIQRRTCTDLNDCNIAEERPDEVRRCEPETDYLVIISLLIVATVIFGFLVRKQVCLKAG